MDEDTALDRLLEVAASRPALPPGLADLNSQSRDDFFRDMERHPMFMKDLNAADASDNPELEALKALAYEGTPREIALNFKNLGNEAFREKNYRDALEFYARGLDAKSGEVDIETSLHLNRAAVNLVLQNYRNVLKDTAQVLKVDKDNVKALYRSGKACLEIEQLDLAETAITHGLRIEPANSALKELKTEVQKRKSISEEKIRKADAAKQKKYNEERLLRQALKNLEISVKATPRPPDLGPILPYHLSDEIEGHRDLTFPTILLYPLTSQTDMIAEFPLSSTLNEQLSMVLEETPQWDTRKEYTVDKVECYMEVEKATGRGLIKVGKAAPLEKALKGRTVFDGIVRIFVIPKAKVTGWVNEWKQMNPQEE